jgi:chromosome segregation ATPase
MHFELECAIQKNEKIWDKKIEESTSKVTDKFNMQINQLKITIDKYNTDFFTLQKKVAELLTLKDQVENVSKITLLETEKLKTTLQEGFNDQNVMHGKINNLFTNHKETFDLLKTKVSELEKKIESNAPSWKDRFNVVTSIVVWLFLIKYFYDAYARPHAIGV